MVTVWNDKLGELKEQAASAGHKILKQQDDSITGQPTEEDEQRMQRDGCSQMSQLFDSLRECKISTNSPTLLILSYSTV